MTFKEELEHLLNKHNQEACSDTPDFILANFLVFCLAAFDASTAQRTEWYKKPVEEGNDLS